MTIIALYGPTPPPTMAAALAAAQVGRDGPEPPNEITLRSMNYAYRQRLRREASPRREQIEQTRERLSRSPARPRRVAPHRRSR